MHRIAKVGVDEAIELDSAAFDGELSRNLAGAGLQAIFARIENQAKESARLVSQRRHSDAVRLGIG